MQGTKGRRDNGTTGQADEKCMKRSIRYRNKRDEHTKVWRDK